MVNTAEKEYENLGKARGILWSFRSELQPRVRSDRRLGLKSTAVLLVSATPKDNHHDHGQ